VLHVEGRAEELARQAGVSSWMVSISHTDSVAVAVVAAL
jgi:phosphopantetheinyl transferase (holo-ACP synthase)